jgi:hypothetical protein
MAAIPIEGEDICTGGEEKKNAAKVCLQFCVPTLGPTLTKKSLFKTLNQ